jgi:hypothetical protein
MAAPGASGHAARPQSPPRRRAGGPCLGGSTRRGARAYGAWDTGRPGWCAARTRVSTPCGPPAAGRALPRVWHASPAPAASTGRPVCGASAPAARARTGAAPSWPFREFLLAARLRAPGAPAAWAAQGDGRGHTVVTLSASHGGGPDGSGVARARGVAVSGATVAAASRGVSQRWGGGSGTVRRPAQATSLRTAGVEGVTRGRGPLGGHESPLGYALLPV